MKPLILKPKEHFDNKTVRTVRYNYKGDGLDTKTDVHKYC